MQQFAILNNKYLYIGLRCLLINIDIILSTNSNWDIFQNLVYNYIKLKKRRLVDKYLKS